MDRRNLSKSSFAAAVFAGGLVVGTVAPQFFAAQPVSAQSASESPFNSAEQRKQMIQQLTQINERLTKIETKLNSGISVKVTEMPPVIMKDKDGK